jgi:predicted double-glycine peptidase
MTHFPRIKQKYACGPAACRFCIRHFFNWDVNEIVLMIEMKTDMERMTTLPRNLMRVMRKYGLIVRSYHNMSIRSLSNHLSKKRLVITPFWDHYHVALVLENDQVEFWEGIQGRLKMSIDEFRRRWIDKDAEGNIYDSYGIVVTK